jgi:CheY-like chemotaxis protein
MADDDEDDRALTRDALQDARLAAQMKFVSDGQELIDYLRHDGAYADGADSAPRPSMILLDLNMPRKDGREVLAEIKADDGLRVIPVVVLTVSHDQHDVRHAYDLGASSFITKPVTPDKLTDVMTAVADYWSRVVELPGRPTGD